MESPPGAASTPEAPPPTPPKRSIKAYVVVLVVLISLAGFAVWWVWFKPYTIAQLNDMARECAPTTSLCRFSPGQTIYVAGTVTRIDVVDVSTGPHTAVYLDDSGASLLFPGDRRPQFAVGQSTTVPLAIRAYTYNGVEYRSADEYPLVPSGLSASFIFSAISRVMGITFLPVSTGPDALTLEVAAHRGEAFPLPLFRFCLIDVQGPFYLGESAHTEGCTGQDWVDAWTPGGNESSPTGRMAFSDTAGNGLLDVGDRITITAHPTASPYALDSELLAVNNASTGILQGLYYWFETSAGVVYYPDPLAVNPAVLQMWSPRGFALGPPEDVDVFELTVAHGPSPAIGDMSYVVRDEAGTLFAQGAFATGPFFTSGGMTGAFEDADGDGQASVGDRLEFRGGQPSAHYTFQFLYQSAFIEQVQWRSGRGAYTGHYPLVAFQGTARVNATTWQTGPVLAGGFPWEETANFTLELWQGSSRVVSVDLRTETNGTFLGQTLRFLLGGDPTHLDAGDTIRAEGLQTGVAYVVRILYTLPRFGPLQSGSWTISN